MATRQLLGDTTVNDLGHISRSLDCFTSNFSKQCVIRQKLGYCRLLIGNHTLAFDWCHFWWPWSTFEGHFSLGCHFHVHFSDPWHAFASHGLPAIAELLVWTWKRVPNGYECSCCWGSCFYQIFKVLKLFSFHDQSSLNFAKFAYIYWW